MVCRIKKLDSSFYKSTVDIFTKAFVNDPLYKFTFPEEKERKRITKLVYKLVILSIVPEMKLKLKGAFVNDKLVGAFVYTTPDCKARWNDKLEFAVNEMRKKANNKKISLIGEYARTSGKLKPGYPHFYLNELAVLPEMQGHGIGTRLMLSVEPECIKHPSASGTWLDTTNVRNVNLYKRLGYKVMKEFNFYGLKGYCMGKRLKN